MNRICTIIAMNYLPQAMALLDSTRKIYPDIEFWILVTDSERREIPYLSSAIILLPEDLDIPIEWLEEMREYYDIVEFATSLKPFLLSTLLSDGVSSVTYLDPDILLFSELSEGFKAAGEFGTALTPHRLTPSNILDPEFSELEFLRYGIFNLGYICVGQKAKPMLKWWSERLRWYSTRFPFDVVFTDQKWMNFIPALFDFKVIRNFGYDLAPWNLDERNLSIVENSYFVNESPLVFIHFSQMSGALALGKQCNYWRINHDSSASQKESLKNVLRLTEDYSSQLIANRAEVVAWLDGTTRVVKSRIRRFRKRQAMIQSSHKRQQGIIVKKMRSNHRNPFDLYTLPWPNIFERSSTLNGAVAGLLEDRRRLVSKYRKIQKLYKSDK
jgi:hypothetical protein